MGNKDAVRTGINLTAADKQIIRRLQRQFEAEHGKQTVTGVIRISIRKAVEQ
jgi:hypothetical protein